MPAKVTLLAVAGPLQGTKYRFDEEMLCLVGRAENCMLQLTGDAANGVSRHHCLLDIRPPQAFICDLNSRNGTYLNEQRLENAENGRQSARTQPLASHDLIKIGNNVFEVMLLHAVHCCICRKELPDEQEEEADPSSRTRRVICPECLEKASTSRTSPSMKTVQYQICAVCGARVASSSADEGKRWEENTQAYICAECLSRRTDPVQTFPMPAIESRRGSSILKIPGYRVIKSIGRGGMGAVYLAESIDTLEKAALKVLLPEIAVHEQCREDFIREANNLKGLHHPGIVELKECGHIGGALYLILEFCNEGSLREHMLRSGTTMPVQTAVDLTCQILDGLEYAHSVRLEQESLFDAQTYTVTGLVHRDIKPANIFLSSKDGVLSAKISDFGLAKAFDMAGISGCTRTGDFSGTLGFIPKQQFLNYKYVRPEVDVWATAATLYFMLTGMPPRNFSNNEDIMKIFSEPPRPIRCINPDVPEKLADVLDAALNDRTTLHFRSADQLRFSLQKAMS